MTRSILMCCGVLAALAACGGGGDAGPVCASPGVTLFGRPNANTGLGDSQCGPRCDCRGDSWEAPLYTAADADQLLTWTLAEPIPALTSNPYDAPAPPAPAAEAVCAVVTDAAARTYRLQGFASEGAARAAGAQPTHFGVCGVCSTLADLAVYMRYPDLTEPVQKCGLDHLSDPAEAHIQCLQDLGFTYPCAQIWYFNTIHTRDACARPCFLDVGQPYHVEDGGLNECLQCDEDLSGAVFKAVAGRTRRNTGIASAMCRPCSEVRPLLHAYR